MRRISEVFCDIGVDPEDIRVVMPLTTGLHVNAPEDVIGFAWTSLSKQVPSIVTFPDREWELSQDYTGLTQTTYQQNLVQNFLGSREADELRTSPVVAFSSGITVAALSAMLHPAPSPYVICLGNALATACAPQRYPLKGAPRDPDEIGRWLNKGAQLRLGGRRTLLDNMNLHVDERIGMPKLGWNLAVDCTLWREVLNGKCNEMEEEDDELKF